MGPRKRILFGLLSVAICLVLVLSGCGGQRSQKEKTVKIGAAVSLTGGLAKEGNLVSKGYRLWRDVVNEKGGINVGGEKYKVELIEIDDKSDAQTAAKLNEKLITEDKVDFVFGPYGSGITQATSTICEKYKMVNIAPLANADSIYERGYKYIFGVLPRASSNLAASLEMAHEYGLDLKTIVILTPDDLFPTYAAEGARAMAEKLGIKVLWFAKYPKGASDFSSMVSEIKKLNPDGVLSSAYFEEAVLLVRQLKEQKVNLKMLVFTGPPAIPDFVKTLGKDAEGIIGHLWWAPNVGWKDPVFGTSQDYANLFRQKYGEEPAYHAAAASGAALLLQMAIEKAGSLDQEKVREQLLKMDVETFFMPVKFGKVDKMEQINIAGKAIPGQIQDGKMVVLYPKKIQQGSPIYPMPAWQ